MGAFDFPEMFPWRQERGVFQWRGEAEGEDAPHQSTAPVFQWSVTGDDLQHSLARIMWNGDLVDDEDVAVVQDLKLDDRSAQEPRDRAGTARPDLVVNMNQSSFAPGLCHIIQVAVRSRTDAMEHFSR